MSIEEGKATDWDERAADCGPTPNPDGSLTVEPGVEVKFPQFFGVDWTTSQTEPVDPGQHYRFEYRGIKLDPFRICKIYNITDFGQQTLVKKALRMGTAHKDRRQDLIDMRSCIDRMLEIMDEDLGDG